MEDRSVDLSELEMAFAREPGSLAFLALAQAYLAQKRYMEAMVVCKKGIRSHPDHLEARLLLAKVYEAQGKLQKALAEVEAALLAHPDAADGHSAKAFLLDASGRFEEAIAAWKQALAQNPSHEAALSALRAKGIEYSPPQPPAPRPPPGPPPAEDGEEAAPGGEEALASPLPAEGRAAPAMPLSPVVSARPGPTAVGRPGPEPQGAGATAPTAQTPSYWGGYDPLAEHRSRKGRPGLGFSFGLFLLLSLVGGGLVLALQQRQARDEEVAAQVKAGLAAHARDTTSALRLAVDHYEAALKLNEDQQKAWAHAAHAYAVLAYERGLVEYGEAAQRTLLRARALPEPHPATVAAGMWQALHQRDPAAALALADAYATTLPEGTRPPPLVRVLQGEAFLRQGRLAEVSLVLDELRKVTTHPGHLTWLGSAYRALGDRLRAREALDLAVRAEPDHDMARAQRALLLLEVRDLSQLPTALDDVTHLQDLGKAALGTLPYGYVTLARAETQRVLGRRAEYERDLATARDILGRNADLLYFEAKARVDGDEDSAAVDLLLEASRLDPYRLRTWEALIRAAATAKRLDDAERAVTEGKRWFPDAIEIPLAQVLIFARQKRLEDAQAMLERMLAVRDDAEVRAELGRVMGIRGDDAGSLEALRRAAEIVRSKPTLVQAEIYTYLGRALAKKGDHDNAVEAFGQAIQLSSKYAEAYYWLGLSLLEQRKPVAAKEALRTTLQLEPQGRRAQAAQAKLDTYR